MQKKIFAVSFLCTAFLFSCTNNKPAIIPVPPDEYFIKEKFIIDIESITETKDTDNVYNAAGSLPLWLITFINGGIEEVEKLDEYYGNFAYIGINEGANFNAIKMWADNFSAIRDFPMLSADRIQKRMISSASLYPDDEYGAFFELMVKNAYNNVYPEAFIKDTYWIKLKTGNDTTETPSHIYNYFILILIDRTAMQNAVLKMADAAYSSVTPTAAQRTSITRLRQNFFTGF